MNPGAFDPTILGPALLAGLLVLATHVPMGQQVLKRGIIFIDLAIAQIAGLGVILADTLGWGEHGFVAQELGVQAIAFCTALLGAALLAWTERHWPQIQEALIGAVFVLAASAGILLLANNPHGGEHLNDLLSGQILWVGMGQLVPTALFTAIILGVWFGLGNRLGRIGFYVLFALAVTTSVQLVGIYLVFSSLILPALAVRNWPPSLRLAGGYGIGVIGYVAGLVLSAVADLPSGTMIVWCLALVAVVAAVGNRRITAAKSILRIAVFHSELNKSR